MKRFLIAAITCLALTVGVSPAAAGSGLGGLLGAPTQTSQQNTNAAGDATASNENGTSQSTDQIQVGSGGDASTGDATAGGWGDATSGDAYGGDVDQSQAASNENTTTQDARAVSTATQIAPVNVNAPVCIAWSCSSGDVSQSNANSSGDATASNENATKQSNDQAQVGFGGDATTGEATTGGWGDATSGDAYGGDVSQSQSASNSNSTTQEAVAVSKATQILPVNVNAPVCIAKHCKTGDVSQSNDNRSGDAKASNANWTGQSNDQLQKGVGGDASTGDATTGGDDRCCKHGGYEKPKHKPDCGSTSKPKPKSRDCTKHERGPDAHSGDAKGGDVDQRQEARNDNDTEQTAGAKTIAKQVAPINVASTPIPWKRGLERCRPC